MVRKPTDYCIRSYRRDFIKHNLKTFNVKVEESDLFISADSDLSLLARRSVHQVRSHLEAYIIIHPEFLTSLTPLPYDEWAPEIVREMIKASAKAGVGPMAAVAGAVAEQVGHKLLSYSRNLIIENGGDIYMNSLSDIHVGLFAGSSPLSDRLFIKIRKEEMPCGVCTSSGTVGHSFSLGSADACCVKSRSTALADAAATAVGNLVKSKRDMQRALEAGMEIEGVLGIVIVVGNRMGAIGDMELDRA